MFKNGFSRKGFAIVGVIGLVIAISTVSFPNKNLEIISFDVQNADAFLLKTPQNKYFIIDTGKSAYKGGTSQAKIIIIKYLKDRGIKNIEGMIITHFDNDHSGGAVDLINNLNVKNVYINSYNNKSQTSVNIYKTLRKKSIQTHLAKNNETIYTENNLSLKTFKADMKEDNENSIITLAKYKNFETLFTGDAGVEAFNEIKEYIPSNIEVLKVGHHGARGVVDDKMIEHLNPKISIISTGFNNFGHPNKGTLDILRKSAIYRTDKNNSIKITTDGTKFNVLTFSRLRHKYELNQTMPASD